MLQFGLYGAANILIQTGAMRGALTEAGASGHVEDVDARGVYVGIDPAIIPYAAYHEFGGSGGRPPQRAMTTLTTADLRRIEAEGAAFVLGKTADLA
jgi:phage gpG-like protein